MNGSLKCMRMLVGVVALTLLAACANMGRPQGGERDEDPPVFVRSNPGQGALNVTRQRVDLYFDENVQIQDAMSKVVVSPAQIDQPVVRANGHRVTVELRDSLLPNTTYTIDFSDAIKDLNEGNVLDGFATDFSTGDYIDTLRISGMVFQAENLEPAQGMLVGVYSNLSDTALTTLPMERITKTNQLGQFTLRNLKPGTYRIFAINDNNRDYKWDRSEDVAFYDVTVSPTSEPSEYSDTLTAADGTDSIVARGMTKFLPDDILLTWFNENYKSRYLVKYERNVRNKIYFEFSTPADTLPEIKIINGPLAGQPIDRWSVLNGSATRDTLEYWIRDSLVINMDSVLLEARYLRTDTLDQLSWTTDTLKFFMKVPKKKKGKDKDKDEEARKRELERQSQMGARDTSSFAASDTLAAAASVPDSLPPVPIDFLKFSVSVSGVADMLQPIIFTSDEPIDHYDPEGVHLEIMEDTVWVELDRPNVFSPEATRPMTLRADYDWEPGGRYRLRIDSASVYSMYGKWNEPIENMFSVRKEEDYSSLTVTLVGLEGRPAVVQLLDRSDKPLRTVVAEGDVARFVYVAPSTYYMRMFIDSNANGRWDTGSVADTLQPEEVYYYPKKIVLRQNWDVDQTWNINELPVDKQKPEDIKKNKPKAKRGERRQTSDEEEEEEEDFFNPGGNRGNRNGRNRGSDRLGNLNGNGRMSTMSNPNQMYR